MRLGVTIALLAWVAGCGPPAPACTGVCVAPSLSRLDLVAGRPGGSGLVDGTGADVHFSDPWLFAGDGAGRVWIVDGSILRAIDESTATVTTLAGRFGVVGGADGVGPAAEFNQPGGMVLVGNTIYLCDTENHALRTVDVASGAVALYAGAIGMPGVADGPVASARWREPEGLVADGAGGLLVADVDNETIRRIDLASGTVTTIAGQLGIAGNADGVGLAATFNKPNRLALDAAAGRLYIGDSFNNSVRAMTLADGNVTTIATLPQAPQGLAVAGGVLWASLGDNRIATVALDGTVTTVAGAAGMNGFADGAAADARFFRPAGLWVEADRVLVADDGNYAVRAVSRADHSVTTLLGAIPTGSADGTGGDARFFVPQGIAVSGDVAWIADTDNHTIRRVEIGSGAVTTVAGSAGSAAFADGTGGDARFNTPIGVALDDGAHILYVADSGNRSIRAVDLASGAVTTLPVNGAPGSMFARFNTPTGLARDGTHLYVSDASDQVIVAVDLATNLVSAVAGTPRIAGVTDGTGSAARFSAPSGLAADGRGALYVADTLNDAVRKIDLKTNAVTTVAGVLGVRGADDGPALSAHFAQPAALAVDGLGDLFVADTLNSLVRRVDLPHTTVSTVIGTLNGNGVALGPLPAQLGPPTALALTPDARLLLASESALLIAH